MTEYETGDTFRDPRTGYYWQITGVSPVYEVTIRPEGDDYDKDDVEVSRFPEESLNSKRDWGDLEPVDFQGGGNSTVDSDDDDAEELKETIDEGFQEVADSHKCGECGKVLETERGLKSHRSQVHEE
jgi:hypothetical protein